MEFVGRTNTRLSMKSENITELKNRLKVYLNDVILVRDRNQPVARIVPLVRSSTLHESK
jgi:antitoxin (DNA-binding transcriptional repressor) of toxin-antitoxin stability system